MSLSEKIEMNKYWINRNHNSECILFFNGWGMDKHAIKNMHCANVDICMFSNYGEFDTFNITEFNYKKIHLVAWSLGVSFAHKLLADSDINISTSIAINGTPFPMHNDYGISNGIFEKTLSSWDERNRRKFNIRMVGGMTNFKIANELISQRSIKDQQTELQFFYDHNDEFGLEKFDWDFALIGDADLIIPSQNQTNYWSGGTKVISKNWAHFPFIKIDSWQQLFEMCEVK